ncbi:MAG: sel1 repeat family protein [Myxococcales bacterium]|nr:MAG: sel1 repeat family protein [Myxococcales bacterium]
MAVLVLGALGAGFGLGSIGKTTALTGPAAARAAAATWTKAPLDRTIKACDGGDATACHGLGQLYQYGDKVGRDEKKAAELFGRSCDNKNVVACAALAAVLVGGEGVPRDEARAVQLYQRACDEGDGVSCADTADLYEAGKGVPKDAARALLFRQQACKAGVSELCK